MDGSFLLGSVVLAIAAVVLFIVFYSLRLLKASRDAKEAAERFQVMMHKQGELRDNFALMGEAKGVSEGSETISSAQGGASGGAASAQGGASGGAASSSQVYAVSYTHLRAHE